MEQHITEFEQRLESYCSSLKDSSLYQPVSYILSLGGKRIRPILLQLAAELYKGDKKNAFYAALAIEIFHNFSLVHDDIMDEAPLRRGKETVHKKWNDNQAILSGDAMLVLAYQCLAKSGNNLLDLHKCFDVVALEVCEGQQLDMDFENRNDVEVDEYIEMIRLKTSVLVGAALEMGAIVANADKNQQEALRQYGENIGIAFQLQDDYLDAFGDSAKVGKQVGGDILANKKTFLLIRLMEEVKGEDQLMLQALLEEQQLSTEESAREKVRLVKSLMTKYKVDEELLQEKEKFHRIAMEAFERIEGEDEARRSLLSIAESLMVRSY